MSLVELNRLAWDLEHESGLLSRVRDGLLDGYALDEEEARAVRDRDSWKLLARGMNPVALRNLMVMLGVPHAQMYPPRDTP
nr:hypothetical protein [Micromonospora sp. DSM 115978]